MSETLEEMARALFKSWFVDFDPVRAKMEGRWRPEASLSRASPPTSTTSSPTSSSPRSLGRSRRGGRWGTLSDIVVRLRDNENPNTLRWIPFSVTSAFQLMTKAKHRKRESGGSIKSAKTRVPPGTVLLSKLNPEVERVWLVDVASDERAICSTEFLVLEARPPFSVVTLLSPAIPILSAADRIPCYGNVQESPASACRCCTRPPSADSTRASHCGI